MEIKILFVPISIAMLQSEHVYITICFENWAVPFFYMPRQLSCRGMQKSLALLDHIYQITATPVYESWALGSLQFCEIVLSARIRSPKYPKGFQHKSSFLYCVQFWLCFPCYFLLALSLGDLCYSYVLG